ncbi:MAG: helicase C-terminal domain-containing protein [Raoultibacter sp.]
MKKETVEPAYTIQNFISDATPSVIRARYERLKADAAAADFGLLDADVVVIDTETTGFSFNHDELTQVAAARMVRGVIVEWFVTFVNPGKPIPEEVAHLTDIHDADVADAPSPVEACAKLAAFVGKSDLVAHNATFDRTFVTKNAGGAPLTDNLWIDSLDLARIALPRLKSHRLIDLVRTFDAPVSTHRADADVEATCTIYRILLAAIAAMPPQLVSYIAGLAPVEQWASVKVFQELSNCQTQAEGGVQKTSEADESGQGDIPSIGSSAALFPENSFDLRKLRQKSLRGNEFKPKIDADELAADPFVGLNYPSAAEIATDFDKEGLIGQLYDTYEVRVEQSLMAESVRHAFETSTNLIVEAGTGVGKSMAYLLPAALLAQRNNITVGIATKTNALLDQIVHKELPLLSAALQRAFGIPLSYAPLKGFSHYPCLRMVNRLVAEEPSMKLVAGKEVSQAPALAGLLSFIEQSEYDDIDGLKIDYRTIPRYAITTTSHECLRRKCPFFGQLCFVHGARRKAEASNIVVTNHSLLFCDLAADGGLLPPIRYWVVDEAHGAESEARRAFSPELSAETLLRLSRRISGDEGSRNIFSRAETAAARAGEATALVMGLSAKARGAGLAFGQAAGELCLHMKDLLYFDTNKRSKGYEYVELWINDQIRASDTFTQLVSYGRIFADSAEKLITACQELVAALEGVEGAAVAQREVATVVLEAKDMLFACETILFKAPPTYAYAATLSKKNDRAVEKLQALLVNVGEKMNATLFANTHSVIFASATLAIAESFEAFETALGLNETEHSRTQTCQLASSYDFDGHMTVYVVEDMPEPNNPAYLEALQKLLIGVHRAGQGSMLSLFTNRKEMEACFNVVQPALKGDDLRVVCQKWGVSVKGLRDDFLADTHLSLFALKSFWEGFDAPGSTLRGVIIPKLPFGKPTDPLSCVRSERDPQAWSHYVLPAAVLETKQAAGRLIRNAEDEGCLILADKRLLTKGYGKVFLRSLPSRTVKVCSMDVLVEELARKSGLPKA